MSTATAPNPIARPNGAPIPRRRPPPKASGLFIPKKHAKPSETMMNSIVGRHPETPPTVITREPTPELSDFEGGPDDVVEFPLIVGNIDPNVTWNVMKFHNVPRGQQIMNSFKQPPVMLNRKEPKYNDHDPEIDISDILACGLPVPPGAEEPKLVPLKGQDGQVVYGADGKPVMVNADTVQPKGRGPVILPGAPPPPKKKPDEKKKPRKNAKKFRQIHTIPEEQRKLRREERYPWVMEDQSETNSWVGRMQDEKPKQLIRVSPQGFFEWYPCYRTYQFNKIPHWRVFNGDEANAEYEKMQKSKDPAAFVDSSLMAKMSSNTQASFRKFAAGSSGSGSGSRGPVGPPSLLAPEQRLVGVIAGQKHAFFKDDDETVIKRESDLFGEDPGEDEHPFEDDVQDDDEGLAEELMDEEEREREERLKKEYRQANKEDYEFDFGDAGLTKAGKATRKLLKAHDKTGAYTDSDSDKNPYLSSEDEEEEEEEVVPPEKTKEEKEKEAEKEEEQAAAAAKAKEAEKTPTKEAKEIKASASSAKKSNSKSNSRSGTPTGKASPNGSRSGSPAAKSSKASASKTAAGNPLRAMSPTPVRGAGNALVAMRATSPPNIIRKPKIPSRGVSPPINAPSPSGSNSKKRKSDDNSGEPSSKKIKTSSGTPASSTPSASSSTPAAAASTGPFPGMLTRDMVITYLRKAQNPATKDAIAHFKPMWAGGPNSDPRNRVLLTTWIKEVATINPKKELLLKQEFQAK